MTLHVHVLAHKTPYSIYHSLYVLSYYYDREQNHSANEVEPGEGEGLHNVGVAGRRVGEGLHSVGVDGHGEGLCRVLFVCVCVCECVCVWSRHN